MMLQIFDVEHGACALLTCDNDTRIMIDCGHNGSSGWFPGSHLKRYGVDHLEMLVVTNYDEDHVSGIENLRSSVSIGFLLRNRSVTADTLKKLKSEDGMGPGIDNLCEMIGAYSGTAEPPFFQGLVLKTFRNIYPTFDDENNLSLVVKFECNGIGVLFTGDLEKAGWLKLLEDSSFANELKSVQVLIASHHGRESGCCEDAMELMSQLYFVVISDKGYEHETQETLGFYRRFARGGEFRGKKRQVLTTRNDGMIAFNFGSRTWGPR